MVAWKEAREPSNKVKNAAYPTDAQYKSGFSSGSSLLVDLLANELGEGHRGIMVYLCVKYKVTDMNSKMQKGWRLRHFV